MDYHAWYIIPFRVSFSAVIPAAIWMYVMYAGVIPKGHSFKKPMMSVRTELSILAVIWSLPQAIIYTLGGTVVAFIPFMIDLINGVEAFGYSSLTTIITYLSGYINFVLLVVLGWTSMKKPKAKMGMAKWRKLQRWAYLFYASCFAQWIFIAVRRAIGHAAHDGVHFYQTTEIIRVIIYIVVLVGYLALMYKRESHKKKALAEGSA